MSVNFNGNNPMEYLKKYAKTNNMNINEAMSALQSQYGNPQAMQLQQSSIFDIAGGPQNPGDPQIGEVGKSFDILGGGPQNIGDPQILQDKGGNIFKNILNFFKNGEGPQKPGDPQGPKGMQGPQRPGDPQGPQGMEGPQKPGDPQGPQGMQGQDPDAYAQQYADENGITLEEAKEELKAKYGDPRQQQGF